MQSSASASNGPEPLLPRNTANSLLGDGQHGKRCLWMPRAHVTALTMSELLANIGSKASHHERCSKCLRHRNGNWIFAYSVLPAAVNRARAMESLSI